MSLDEARQHIGYDNLSALHALEDRMTSDARHKLDALLIGALSAKVDRATWDECLAMAVSCLRVRPTLANLTDDDREMITAAEHDVTRDLRAG